MEIQKRIVKPIEIEDGKDTSKGILNPHLNTIPVNEILGQLHLCTEQAGVWLYDFQLFRQVSCFGFVFLALSFEL